MKLLKPLTASDRKWLRRSRRILLAGFIIFLVGFFLPYIRGDGTPILITASMDEWLNPGNQKKLCRTDDNTIHAGLWLDVTHTARHFWSMNNGSTWNSETILTNVGPFSLDCAINGDLLFTARNYTNSQLLFRRAAVTKGTPWNWSWQSATTVSISGTWRTPDIIGDSNGYIHIIDTNGSYAYWFRSLNNGTSWTGEGPLGFTSPYYMAILRDTSDNLYWLANPYTGCTSYYIPLGKVDWNGTAWGYKSYTLVGAGNPVCFAIMTFTPDDYLLMSYTQAYNQRSVAFMRASFPHSISSGFSAPVYISQMMDVWGYAGDDAHGIAVLNSTAIRVYFSCQRKTCEGAYVSLSDIGLYYKESLDGGSSFGSLVIVSVGNYETNNQPQIAKYKASSGHNDYMWRKTVTATGYDYVYYNAELSAPPGTTTTTTSSSTSSSTTTLATTTTTTPSFDLGGVCSGIGDALGISDDAGCMLISFILLFMILVPLGMLTKSFWVLLIVGFTFAGFLTAIQWLPLWIMLMLCLITALMLGSRLTGMISRGGSEESD